MYRTDRTVRKPRPQVRQADNNRELVQYVKIPSALDKQLGVGNHAECRLTYHDGKLDRSRDCGEMESARNCPILAACCVEVLQLENYVPDIPLGFIEDMEYEVLAVY